MRMFTPDGTEVLVDKEQIPALEASGWTRKAPVEAEDAKVEAQTESPDETADAQDEETESTEETAETDKEEPAKKTAPSKIKRVSRKK